MPFFGVDKYFSHANAGTETLNSIAISINSYKEFYMLKESSIKKKNYKYLYIYLSKYLLKTLF